MGTKEIVMNVLRSTEVQKLRYFSVYGSWFNPMDLLALADNIEYYDAPAVKYSKTLDEGTAYYNSTNNVLALGLYQAPQSINTKSLIVHEATHAMCDMKKMPMSVVNSEVMAWIVQCQFAKANNPYPKTRYLKGKTWHSDQCFQAAWWLAGNILDGFQPKTSELGHLRSALLAHPSYGSAATGAADYAGV